MRASRSGIRRVRLGGRLKRHEASTQAVTAVGDARKLESGASQGSEGGLDGEGEWEVRARVRWMGQQRLE